MYVSCNYFFPRVHMTRTVKETLLNIGLPVSQISHQILRLTFFVLYFNHYKGQHNISVIKTTDSRKSQANKNKKARCEILSTSITTELAEHPYPGKLQIQRKCCFIQLMPLTDNFSKKMRCTCFYQYLNNYCIVSILVNPPSSSDRDRVHILICFKPGVGMTFRIKLSQIIT